MTAEAEQVIDHVLREDYAARLARMERSKEAASTSERLDATGACRDCVGNKYGEYAAVGSPPTADYMAKILALPPHNNDMGILMTSTTCYAAYAAWDPTPTRIPDEYAKSIIRLIEEFLRDCPGALASHFLERSVGRPIAEECMLLLKGTDQGAMFRVKMQRAQWESEIAACFCGVNEGLLRCSKCKIVAYCSPAHQHSDWPKHKKRCFKPSFD
ncbi:hypothetical protein BDZ89DRAFT_1040365 [Hymenopellis radicata]|nr:hypothetical protein BDZ89DRAFT_1040365 [Hymenopellis radicata]